MPSETNKQTKQKQTPNQNKISENKCPGEKLSQSIMVMHKQRQQLQDTAEVMTNTRCCICVQGILVKEGRFPKKCAKKSFTKYNGDTT